MLSWSSQVQVEATRGMCFYKEDAIATVAWPIIWTYIHKRQKTNPQCSFFCFSFILWEPTVISMFSSKESHRSSKINSKTIDWWAISIFAWGPAAPWLAETRKHDHLNQSIVNWQCIQLIYVCTLDLLPSLLSLVWTYLLHTEGVWQCAPEHVDHQGPKENTRNKQTSNQHHVITNHTILNKTYHYLVNTS